MLGSILSGKLHDPKTEQRGALQNTGPTSLLERQNYSAYHQHTPLYTELYFHTSQYNSDTAIALAFDYLRHGASECGNCVMDS